MRSEKFAMLLVLGILLFVGAMAQDEVCEHQLVLERGEQFTMGFRVDLKKDWNTCKWLASSPSDTRMTVSCSYADLAQAGPCTNDAISVSVTGDKEMKEPSVHCGPEAFTEDSTGNQVAVQLKLSKDAEIAFITCSIRAKKSV